MDTIQRNVINDVIDKAKQALFNSEDFISLESKTKVSNSVLKVKAAYANQYVYFTVMVSDAPENNVLFAMHKRYTYKQFTNSSVYDNVWNSLIKFLNDENKLSGDSVEVISIATPKGGNTLGYAFTW